MWAWWMYGRRHFRLYLLHNEEHTRYFEIVSKKILPVDWLEVHHKLTRLPGSEAII